MKRYEQSRLKEAGWWITDGKDDGRDGREDGLKGAYVSRSPINTSGEISGEDRTTDQSDHEHPSHRGLQHSVLPEDAPR